MTDQHAYWTRREQQERDSAERASDTAVRKIHTEMADRYSALKGAESLRATISAQG